jgi:ribonucleoside-diphosphate reductase alpha chain
MREGVERESDAATGEQANMLASAIPASASASASNRRSVLPTTRQSVTHKFSIAGHEGYLTIGLFDDVGGTGSRPGEIFIKMSKEGSTLSGLIQGFCRAFSLALQYGLSIQDACDRFRGMRFDPMGPTSNPDIPEALSILDYVARYLELHYSPSRTPAGHSKSSSAYHR